MVNAVQALESNHSMCDLKDALMNMQCILIWELIICESKCQRNNQKFLLCESWRQSWSQYSKQVVQEGCIGCKNLDNQARSGRPKTAPRHRNKSNEYEVSLTYDSLVWFITLLIASTAAKLYLITKICKTFDSPL